MLRRTKWLIGLGAVLAVIAVAIPFVGNPVLVRYPLNINETLQFQGTATVYMDPATGARLATPLEVPLNIDQQVKVVSGTYSHAVVAEILHLTFAGSTRTETYQYYMNRRTMQLVNGTSSYAFGGAADAMAPGGSYRVNFPTGTNSHSTYTLWVPQTASTVQVKADRGPQHDPVSGEDLITFYTSLDHTVAPYYMQYLAATGMPTTLPPAAVQAQLQAAGASLADVLKAVGPHLTASQLSTLNAAMSSPIPLTYSYFQEGQVSVQPKTGAVISANSSREGISVTPSLIGLAPVQAILAPYANLPAVQSLFKAAASLGTSQVVLQMSYRETPASVREAARVANHQASLMSLIDWQIPVLVGAVAVLALLLALVWRPRPGASPAETHIEHPGEHRRAA